jgi:hypothetical protein
MIALTSLSWDDAVCFARREQQPSRWARSPLHSHRLGDAIKAAGADHVCNRRRSSMTATTASLWQLVRDDQLVRRGAYACVAVVWFAAAWADLKILLLIPMIGTAIYVLYRRRGEIEDDSDLL